MKRAGIIMMLAAVTACTAPPADDAAAPAGKDGNNNAVAVERPVAPLTGAFTAISTTATAMTGDLDLGADALRFKLDQEYRIGPATRVSADTAYAASGGKWTGLLSVPADASIEIHPVAGQTVGAKAVNGGLCRTEKVAFVAFALGAGTARDSLALAAFKGQTAPGPHEAEENLCGTFNYAPAQGG